MVAALAAVGGAKAMSDDIKWYYDRERAWKIHQSNWERQKAILQNQLLWRVQDARKAGIHPLAALGLSPASGPSESVFSGGGESDWSGLFSAMRGIKTAEERKLAELEIEKQEALIEGIKQDNKAKQEALEQKPVGYLSPTGDLVLDELNRMGAGLVGNANAGNGLGTTGTDITMMPKSVPYSEVPGRSAGTVPFVDPYLDESGRRRTLIGQGASEPMESDPVAWVQHVGLTAKDYASSWWHFNYNWTKAAERHRSWLMYTRPKAPKGYHYRYNVPGKYWQLHKSNRVLLYDGKHKYNFDANNRKVRVGKEGDTSWWKK